ncbi:MAG: site-specific integrase, partial [Balneolaceae bacterium]
PRSFSGVGQPQQMRLWFKPMISMVYYCGLRAKEAVNLTWTNVDLDEGYIRVVNSEGANTKSGKDRTIPIRKELQPVLKQWYKDQNEPKDGYAFPSAIGFSNKQKMDSGALSRSLIHR